VCNACRREKYAARKVASESGGMCCGSVELGAAQGRLKGHKAAPITSRGLTAKTIEES